MIVAPIPAFTSHVVIVNVHTMFAHQKTNIGKNSCRGGDCGTRDEEAQEVIQEVITKEGLKIL